MVMLTSDSKMDSKMALAGRASVTFRAEIR